MAAFSENVITPEDKTWISSHVEVSVDDEGYFVNVCTDAWEGNAMMTLPCAEKCIDSLTRAVAHAKTVRAALGSPVNASVESPK